jgi:hypothetical protein
LLDPAAELTEAEEFGELHAASAAVMLSAPKRATLVVWEFFMRSPRWVAIVPSERPNGSAFVLGNPSPAQLAAARDAASSRAFLRSSRERDEGRAEVTRTGVIVFVVCEVANLAQLRRLQ